MDVSILSGEIRPSTCEVATAVRIWLSTVSGCWSITVAGPRRIHTGFHDPQSPYPLGW